MVEHRMSLMAKARRSALWAFGIAALLFTLVAGRACVAARAEFVRGDELAAEGKPDEAALHYERALRWYFPGSPYAARAVEQLYLLAEEEERTGSPELALARYRALRSGIYAIRHVRMPFRDTVQRVDARIAELSAKRRVASGRAGDLESEIEKSRRRLANDRAPSRGWSTASGVGFIGWIGGVLGLIFEGWGRKKSRVSRVVFWIAWILCCYALWSVGLLKA